MGNGLLVSVGRRGDCAQKEFMQWRLDVYMEDGMAYLLHD